MENLKIVWYWSFISILYWFVQPYNICGFFFFLSLVPSVMSLAGGREKKIWMLKERTVNKNCNIRESYCPDLDDLCMHTSFFAYRHLNISSSWRILSSLQHGDSCAFDGYLFPGI